MVNFRENYCAMCSTNHSLSQLSTRLNIITAQQRTTYHPSLNITEKVEFQCARICTLFLYSTSDILLTVRVRGKVDVYLQS